MRKLIPTIVETKQLPDFSYLELDKIIVPVTANAFAAAVIHLTAAKFECGGWIVTYGKSSRHISSIYKRLW